ncbi:conserved protein of unknown function [Xenorhabdus poinarii G6]|uniref:DUF2829 domain-containing protein n=1 Tax=Xenorhabdus poinarii G6 TaxID=1354304 RepID=A0A068R663_9GAMM|nr:MW1434 family type I TA system toxin [Xenorhabdus poinarii]CDG21615.1 conserved protein of unknown function [Xenorhabdus poinarii G6]
MSDVNKLDNKQCPFDPEQYKEKFEIDDIAPAGSFPWAMIKMYLGGQLYRKDWSASGEYIYFVAGDGDHIAPEVKMRDKHGILTSWQPTQDDMMACDWIAMDCMLSFYLKIEVVRNYGNSGYNWGYLADEELAFLGENSFGDLTNFQTKTDIKEFSLFIWWDHVNAIDIRVSSDRTQDGYQKMKELFGKNLTVTSNGVSYSLGQISEGSQQNGAKQYEFAGSYANTDATKLGDLLKQNVGRAVHFCFNWK